MIAAGTLLFPIAARAGTLDVYTHSSITFRAIEHTSKIELRWKRYRKPKQFVSYEIYRSTTPFPLERLAGDLVATTSNRYSTNYDDHPAEAGTYWYRLCVIKKNGEEPCSPGVKAVLKQGTAATQSVSAATTTEPTVVFQDSQPGELQLSATPTGDGGLTFSWTPFVGRGSAFLFYKLVRSQTVTDPQYPRDGYLAHTADQARVTFIESAPPSGAAYYRVCAVDAADGLWCGNVVSVNPL